MKSSLFGLALATVATLGLCNGANSATDAAAIPATASPALLAAWQGYYKTLDEMRLKMESTPRFQNTPQHRAKAYHTLMEMQAMAYTFIISPRLSQPRIFTNSGWQTDVYTLGQNGPDFKYGVLFVDGRQTYKLKGRLGDIKLFLVQVLNGVFGEKDVKSIGNYDLADMNVGADGRFELTMGGPPQAHNWIALDPKVGYQFILIRRALYDWADDAGDLQVERVSAIPDGFYDADEFSEAAMAERIHRAELFLRYLTDEWNVGLYDKYQRGAGGEINKVSLLPGTVTSQVGSPSSNYALGLFKLQDDEALVIEFDRVPDGRYWSLQLGDVWSRSLDFRTRQTSINNAKAVIDKDGAFRAVISKRDPGVANWLDTTGRVEGTIVFRNYRAKTASVPKCRVVKLDQLRANLPKDTAWVTPTERLAALEHRRQAFLKLYGE